MILKEYYMTRSVGVRLYKTYSDRNKYIIQQTTCNEYSEAIDGETATYTYIESERDIEEM